MADAPITNLQIVQRGIESQAGTLVPATHRVPIEPGTVKLNNTIDIIRRRYSGSLATSHSSSAGLSHVGVAWDERGTYDYLAVLLSQFLAPTVTGTGAQADKTWTFDPNDTADDLKRASIEVGGKDTWAEEEHLAGCVGSVLEIAWNKNDDWMLSVEYVGTRSTQAAKTGALTLPATLVPILGRLTKAYMDPTSFGSGAMGKAISGVVRIENILSPRFGADGNDYANRIAVLGRKVSASLVVEYDATTLRAAWRGQTVEKIRVEAPGPSLGGSTYNARLDVPGTFDTSEIGDDDGIVTLAHDLVATYDAGITADINATVVCSLAAIP